MPSSPPVDRVRAEGLAKRFCRDPRPSLRYALADLAVDLLGRAREPHLRPGEFWALREVSFSVAAGECLGVIGANGAGKSTLLRLLHRRLRLDAGRIETVGTVAAISDLGLGFDPALTGRENARRGAALLGLGPGARAGLVDSILDFAELGEELAEAPVATYSSGMRARLGFAVAAHLEPEILLVDEALAVGDLAFRRKCLRHMAAQVERGCSLLLVSHDLYSVQTFCPRALLLEAGRVAALGETSEVIARYLDSRQEQTAAGPVSPAAADDERPLVILGAELTGPDGGPCTGEPARVVVRYRSRREIAGVPWAFQVLSGDGLLEVATAFGALERDGHALRAGEGTLSCRLPKLALLAGTYGLRVAIAEPGSRELLALFGFREAPAPFSVRPATGEAANLLRISRAFVALDTDPSPD